MSIAGSLPSTSAVAGGGGLGPDEASRLLHGARLTLREALSGDPWARPLIPPGVAVTTVNVTLYTGTQLRASMSGRGVDRASAVRDAVHRAAVDRRFAGPLTVDDVAGVRIDLWIRVRRERMSVHALRARFDAGLHGVELRVGDRRAYYKPSVALTSHVTTTDRLLDMLARKARLPETAWRRPDARVWLTSWEHLLHDPASCDRPIRLRRMRPLHTPFVTTVELRRMVRDAQKRLLTVQTAPGYYAYRYFPFEDRFQDGPGNLVRQAGCAYAVAWSAQHEAQPARRRWLAESARRALAWLLGHRRLDPAGGVHLDDEGPQHGPRPGKLGAGALALLALQYVALHEADPVAHRLLLEGVAGRQNPDGSFRCFATTTDVSSDGRAQSYYPGEACLALARLARRTGSAPCDLEATFEWYAARFRRRPDAAFVMWHAAAWRTEVERARVPGATPCDADERRARFVLEIVDWLLTSQLEPGACDEDMVGGFAVAGRAPDCATATFVEAVVHGHAMASLLDDRHRIRRYRAAIRRGLGFLMRLQIPPRIAMLFPAPARAVGGTAGSLSDFTIQCDHDQHLITAALAALETPRLLD